LAMVKELLRHIFRKPVTLKYPFEKRRPTEGMRGRPVWDMERCVGCELCFRDCPSGAIEMTGKGSEAEFKHSSRPMYILWTVRGRLSCERNYDD